MDQHNPFRPTFGVPPLYWVGRTAILDSFRTSLASHAGAPGRAIIISGARGIGKTVLLNELEDIAAAKGWITLRASGRSSIVEELVETTIPAAIEKLSPRPKHRISRVGVSPIGTVGIDTVDDAPFKHNLNTRLRELAAQLQGTGILISIDEIQDADIDDLTTIAVTVQDLIRDELDIAFTAAGLPQGVNAMLDLPGATFLRRAQKFILGPLSPPNTDEAFRATSQDSGITFNEQAVADATAISRGYPYLVQLLGSLAWSRAHDSGRTAITTGDVAAVSQQAIHTLGLHVHQPAVTSLSQAPREFLRAMATAATDGVATIKDIADSLERTPKSLSATRQRLIDADLIEPTGHGTLAFVVPYMGEHLLGTDRLGRVD